MERVDLENRERRFGGRYILGAAFIMIGLAFLLNNLDLIPEDIEDYVFSWQMLLIGIGGVSLAFPHRRFSGLILIAVGAFFLVPRMLGFNQFDFTHMFWPILLIFIGIMVMLRHRGHRCYYPLEKKTLESTDMIDDISIFGGSKKQIVNKNFRGGRVTAIFGGSELDFTQSKLAAGTQYLEITSIFGGASIIVPNDWNVHIDVNSILGGFADKRRINPISSSPENILIIKGVAIFGGGEIKTV